MVFWESGNLLNIERIQSAHTLTQTKNQKASQWSFSKNKLSLFLFSSQKPANKLKMSAAGVVIVMKEGVLTRKRTLSQ